MPTNRKIQLSPSILSADFARLGEQVREAEQAGADRIQIDVMDGHFVPNITVGPLVVEALRPHTSLILEAHLMIERPELYIPQFAKAGADYIIVHVETCPHLHRTVQQIHGEGKKASVTLNPATPLAAIEEILEYADMILVMTVNPGFGGQKYIATMEAKIAEVRALIDRSGHDVDVEVDGGLDNLTVVGAVDAGANVIVAGSALYRDPDGLEHAVTALRSAAEAARGG